MADYSFIVKGKSYPNFNTYWKENQYNLNSENILRDIEYTNKSGQTFPSIGSTQQTPYIQTRPVQGAIAAKWKKLTTEPIFFLNDPDTKYHALLNSRGNLTFVKYVPEEGGQPLLKEPVLNPSAGQPVLDENHKNRIENIITTGTVSGEAVVPDPKPNPNPSPTPPSTDPNRSSWKYTDYKYIPTVPQSPSIGEPETKLKNPWDPDWDHLYDIAGAGLHIGNAIRNYRLALEAEKPLLHDPVEHHHAVYGNYAAKVGAQLNAGNLFNAASRPISSDIAQTQASQLQSLIAANEAITQGDVADNAKRELTAEIAWQLEKENRNNRHEVAMSNRDDIFKTRVNLLMNKQQLNAGITNVLDTVRKVWQADWQKYRDKKLNYQDLYEQEFATYNGLDSYLLLHPEIDADSRQRAFDYLYNKSSFDTWYKDTNVPSEQKSRVTDIIRNAVLLGHLDYYKKKGVRIPERQDLNQDTGFNPEGMSTAPQFKSGGNFALQREILKKRQKDEDRFAKIILKDNDRFLKAVFKHVDKMYRIGKYSAGSGILLTEFTPVRTPSEQITPPIWFNSGGLDASKGSSTNSKLNDLLKSGDALDNDRARISKMKDQVLSMEGLADSQAIEAACLEIQDKIKLAENHKKSYDDAVKELQSLNALGEAYIDTNGLIMIETPLGYTKTASIEEALSNRIVTYGEALQNRNSDPNSTFNYALILDMASGIGMKNVIERLNSLTSTLDPESEAYEALGRIENGHFISGYNLSLLHQLELVMARDHLSLDEGLYKYKQENSSNYKRLIDAAASLFESLTPQQLQLIKLKSAQTSLNYINYLLTLLSPRLKTSYKEEISLVADHERDSKAKEKELELKNDAKVTPMDAVIKGKASPAIVADLQVNGRDIESGPGNVAASMAVYRGTLTRDNKTIQTNKKLTALDLIQNTDMLDYGLTERMTFLGLEVSNPNMVILENNNFYVANLPSKDGVPNFQLFAKMKNICKNLKGNFKNIDGKDITPEDFNNITARVDESTLEAIKMACAQENINLEDFTNFLKFLFCYAIAPAAAFELTNKGIFTMFDEYKTPENLGEIIDSEQNNLLSSVVSTINTNRKDAGEEALDLSDLGNKMWRGAVYIPYYWTTTGSDKSLYTEKLYQKIQDLRTHRNVDVKLSANNVKN